MSSNSRLQALLGGESADTTTVVVAPEAFVETQQDVAIAQAETELEQAQVEITETQNDMEVLEERVEDLEEKIDGVESMLNGTKPWNPELAQSFYDSARKIDARTFGEANAVSVKGAECFSDKDAAQLELVNGLESLKEKAGKMGEAIKQFFINLYNTIKNFFVGLFNRFRGIEGKASALVTRLNGVADDKIKKEITLGSWNAFIDAEKNKGSAGSVGATIKATGLISRALSDGAVKSMVAQVGDALSGFAADTDSKKAEGSSDNTQTITCKEGGIEFTVVIPVSSPKDEAAALSATKVSYKVNKDGVKTSGTLTTGATKASLLTVAKAVVQNAKDAQIAGFKESELKTKRDKAIAKIEVAARGTDADKGETKKEIAITRNAHNAGLRAAMVLMRYSGDVQKSQLAYVGAHL